MEVKKGRAREGGKDVGDHQLQSLPFTQKETRAYRGKGTYTVTQQGRAEARKGSSSPTLHSLILSPAHPSSQLNKEGMFIEHLLCA